MILGGRHERFSPEVVRRVRQADAELHYSEGKFATATGLVGSDVLYCIRTLVSDGPLSQWHSRLAYAFETRCGRGPGELFIKSISRGRQLDDVLADRQRTLAGVILHGFRGEDLPTHPLGLPHVHLVPHSRIDNAPSVLLDNQAGTLKLVEHLARMGHRRVCFLGSWSESTHTQTRLDGYLLGLRRCRLVEAIPYEDLHRPDRADHLIDNFLDHVKTLADPPTAVVCSTTLTATKLMHQARDYGIDIPGDLSVTGFLDYPVSTPPPLPLTCIHAPIEQLAETTWLLLKQYNQLPAGQPLAVTVPCGDVVEGRSVKRLA